MLNLFPENVTHSTEVLVVNFSETLTNQNFKIACELRKVGIKAEIFPDVAKLKKQFAYADAKKIKYVIVAGEDEIKTQLYSFKNMITGEQELLSLDNIIQKIKS